jgi:hypothetical protein
VVTVLLSLRSACVFPFLPAVLAALPTGPGAAVALLAAAAAYALTQRQIDARVEIR